MAFETSHEPGRCPKCGALVDKLYYVRYSTTVGSLTMKSGHEDDPFGEDTEKIQYCCPECCDDLFANEQEATAFLEGPKSSGFKW
jgi:hypothetical protein